jgi:hypothetical protein
MMTVVMFLRPGVLSIRCTPGSAKPGRGGRRKRKRQQAADRAWALIETLERKRRADSPGYNVTVRRWFRLFRARQPEILGRRERRRRAKLRRRRARARREARPTPIAAPMPWEAATLEHATGAHLDRLAELFGVEM